MNDTDSNPFIEAMNESVAQRVFSALQDEPDDLNDLPEIAGFKVLREIGGGGAATVYQGVRRGHGGLLAIKLLKRRLENAPNGQRAWRELDVLGQLRLPTVPRVVDYGIHDGRLYIVTNFIDGLTLDRFCARDGLSLRERVELLARAADIVQQLHERGVIHRDIKPKNILVDSAGEPAVVDLGLASLISPTTGDSITAEGVALGTPAYMAPEQACGDRGAMSTRCDVYGLGATAYCILTGHTPHDMDTEIAEALRRVVQEDARDPRTLAPRLDRILAAILVKSVSRQPQDRYASAAALATDFRRWLDGEPTEAGRASMRQRAGRFVARHPLATTAILCGMMITTTIATCYASYWWTTSRPHRLRTIPSMRQVELLSASGHVLEEWQGSKIHTIPEFIIDPVTKKRCAILGFESALERSTQSGLLCVYNVDGDLDEPYWSAGIEDDHWITTAEDVKGTDFGINHVDVDDFFPGGGPEILAIHQHSIRSLCAVRIYDLSGNVLFDAWHDGNLDRSYWLADRGRLVLSGVDGAVTLDELGYKGIERNHLRIILALDIGFKEPVLLAPDGDDANDALAWYLYLLPVAALDELSGITALEAPLDGYAAGGFVRVTIGLTRSKRAGVSWIIDADGEEVDTTRNANDEYGMAERQGGPAVDLFHLGDRPPLMPPQGSLPQKD